MSSTPKSSDIILSEFAADTKRGLTASPKFLLSKYIYDERGSQLFQDIMNTKEYYLTNAEHEVFELQKQKMLDLFQAGTATFELLEFGAGDGLKTKVLLRHFTEQKANFEYLPIDISEDALEGLSTSLAKELPSLIVKPLHDTYFTALEKLEDDTRRKIVLFLGSNIGNFRDDEALGFFKHLRKELHQGDMAVIGADLRKDPNIIRAAYDDAKEVTRDFHLNHLVRMNRELGANFDLNKFGYYTFYNPETGEVRSYLYSKAAQTVYIEHLDLKVSFTANEAIHTEISRKYTLEQLEQMAQKSGFEVVEHLFDSRYYFTDTVWRAV